MLIEVSEIHPPRIGGKVSRIVAADGEHYEIWPDKLVGIDVGKRYEVEIRERQYNERTIKSIKSIKPAAATDAGGSPAASPAEALPHPGEAEYVGRVLAALIAKGELTAAQIPAFTARLREVWRG